MASSAPGPAPRSSGVAASLAAIFASILTVACCLPFGFLGAAGAAGAAVFLRSARWWLLLLSVALLGLGFYQLRRGLRCGVRRARLSMAVFGVAVVVLVLMALFPQVIAAWLADSLGSAAP